jgi:long-chain fatty acid transport protein
MHTTTAKGLRAVALLGLGLGAAGTASGAGFAIIEDSAQGMGNAFAGGAAAAEDLSTVFFNPAGMTRIEGTQIQAAGHVIIPTFEYTDRGSFQKLGDGVTIPLLPGANTSEDGGTVGLVPNFYYKRDLTDRLKFGLGVNAPFGLKTEYGRKWIGRFQAVESEILTINANPALAYRVTDALSVGVGLNIMYMDAKLSNAVDFDAVCGGTAVAVVTASGLVPAPLVPGTAAATCTGTPGSGAGEGFVENEADDVSLGFNIGFLFEFSKDSRFGIHYRSEVQQELDGDADFKVPTTLAVGPFGPATQGAIDALFADGDISANVDLPATLSASVFHRFHPKFAVMGDATWTGWDSVQELRIKFATPGAADGVEALGWENTWRVGVGLNYYHSNKLTLRAGFAYDESPVPNLTMRTARLPDNDRTWVSIGASYAMSDRLQFDAGYTHLFIPDTSIARTGSTGSVLKGRYESDADLLSAQVRYRFD